LIVMSLGSPNETRTIREACRETRNAVAADELRRRLAAYRRYVANKEVATKLEGEQRLTEVLIGHLLGPAELGRPSGNSPARTLSGLTTQRRVEFRRLVAHEAAAHGTPTRASCAPVITCF